jgi:hypothetical protein
MGLIKRKKCKHCGCLFVPDARNTKRQRFCKKSQCRKASKKYSQQRWLQKPENRDHFRGPINVERVRQWRKANPGYWRGKVSHGQNALQEPLSSQPVDINKQKSNFVTDALQDLLIAQPYVLIGLISSFTGNALQDDIAKTMNRLQQLGRDILNLSPSNKGADDDCKRTDQFKPGAQGAQAVQLARSAPGP